MHTHEKAGDDELRMRIGWKFHAVSPGSGTGVQKARRLARARVERAEAGEDTNVPLSFVRVP